MKRFVDILPAPREIANWLKSVVMAKSVQSLTRYIELKKVVRLRKVKNRGLLKIGNTNRATGEFPFRDELSANP